MTKEEEIIKRLENHLKSPGFSKPDLMAKLDGLAEDALVAPSEQGLISAILIYQQLVEEMLKITFETAQLVQQVQLLPIIYQSKSLNKKMFGQVIKEFESIIEFPSKVEMIDLANKINRKRINVAHKLMKNYDLNELNIDAQAVNKWFFKFFKHYDIAQEWLNSALDKFYMDRVQLN